jgi:hypothetical protein
MPLPGSASGNFGSDVSGHNIDRLASIAPGNVVS